MLRRIGEPPTVENCAVCEKYCIRQEHVKLAGVKRSLYNPHLASYAKGELDTMQGKLSDEHSKTTLPLTVAELPPELFFNYNPSCSYVPRYDTLPLPSKWIRAQDLAEKLSLERNEELKNAYLNFRGTIPFVKGRLVQIPSVREFHFLNYKIRYKKPEHRQIWRDHLKRPQTSEVELPPSEQTVLCSPSTCEPDGFTRT